MNIGYIFPKTVLLGMVIVGLTACDTSDKSVPDQPGEDSTPVNTAPQMIVPTIDAQLSGEELTFELNIIDSNLLSHQCLQSQGPKIEWLEVDRTAYKILLADVSTIETVVINCTAKDDEGLMTEKQFSFTVSPAAIAKIKGQLILEDGNSIEFDAINSYSIGDVPLTFIWTIEGEGVSMIQNGSKAIVTTEFLEQNRAAKLTLTVSNEFGSSLVSQNLEVAVKNYRPIAVASQPMELPIGEKVMLSCEGSYDPEQQPLAYQWTQVLGETVADINLHSCDPSFTVPMLPQILEFELVVSDGEKTSQPTKTTLTTLALDDFDFTRNAKYFTNKVAKGVALDSIETHGGRIKEVIFESDVAYVLLDYSKENNHEQRLDRDVIDIYSFANPLNPQLLGTYWGIKNIGDLMFYQNHLIFSESDGYSEETQQRIPTKLQLLDVSNPLDLTNKSTIIEQGTGAVTMLEDQLVHFSSRNYRLFDLANLSQIPLPITTTVKTLENRLMTTGKNLYAVDRNNLHHYQITAANQVNLISTKEYLFNVGDIVSKDGHIYVAGDNVVNIYHAQTFELVNEISTLSTITDLHIKGDYLLVANQSIQIFDIQSNINPVQTGFIPNYHNGRIDDIGLIGDYIITRNVYSDMAIHTLAPYLKNRSAKFSLEGLKFAAANSIHWQKDGLSKVLTIAATTDGVYLIDITEKLQPIILDYINAPLSDSRATVSITDQNVYLTGQAEAYKIVLSDDLAFQQLQKLTKEDLTIRANLLDVSINNIHSMIESNGFLYVGTDIGLFVFNADVFSHLTLFQSVYAEPEDTRVIRKLEITDGYLVALIGPKERDNVHFFNFDQSNLLEEIGSTDTYKITDWIIQDDLMYMAREDKGVELWDISNKASSKKIKHSETPYLNEYIALDDQYLYVAGSEFIEVRQKNNLDVVGGLNLQISYGYNQLQIINNSLISTSINNLTGLQIYDPWVYSATAENHLTVTPGERLEYNLTWDGANISNADQLSCIVMEVHGNCEISEVDIKSKTAKIYWQTLNLINDKGAQIAFIVNGTGMYQSYNDRVLFE